MRGLHAASHPNSHMWLTNRRLPTPVLELFGFLTDIYVSLKLYNHNITHTWDVRRTCSPRSSHMDCIEKLRVCIGFCFKLGKTASESFKILKQTFKEDALSQSRTFEWFARLKAGRISKRKQRCSNRSLSGLVHYEFVPECQTINQHYYIDVLRRLREPTRKWHQKNWLLHHDNARPHTAVTVQLYLAKHGIALLPQPPYSPDLAPNDFFLYLKIKRVLKESRFDSIPEIKENSKNILKSLKDEDFLRCFDIWKKRWNKISLARYHLSVVNGSLDTVCLPRPLLGWWWQLDSTLIHFTTDFTPIYT
ncbi:hypothetical protein LAZ67_12000835 [Cordylochernes scorpioides]|uniref:Mos1 transposase HTH domain-containing protein n=1 Tax=Cordylochernes scorpioides TaxID=51811 RepID=A0ABY6L5R1_9ARAC|nr:hypothetical protein LAZ67_12000835 [Cordylochernes scorpioides]